LRAASLIFLRGILKSGERALFSFSGTIKRVRGSHRRRAPLPPSLPEIESGTTPAPPTDQAGSPRRGWARLCAAAGAGVLLEFRPIR